MRNYSLLQNILKTLAVSGLVLFGVILIVSFFPLVTHLQTFVVQSGSMEPTIKTGAILVVRQSADYKVGDIITFGNMSRQKVPTTHRIVAMRAQAGVIMYTTKGDANNAPDTQETPGSIIIGKVLVNVPYLGYGIDAIKKPYGFVAILLIPGLYIIAHESKKIWREIKSLKTNPS